METETISLKSQKNRHILFEFSWKKNPWHITNPMLFPARWQCEYAITQDGLKDA